MHYFPVIQQYIALRRGQDTLQNLNLQYIPRIFIFYLLLLAFYNTKIPAMPAIIQNFMIMFRKNSTRDLDKHCQKISASSTNENVSR